MHVHASHPHHCCSWHWWLPFLLSAMLVTSSGAQAQGQAGQRVVVSLRDVAARGLGQVTVTLRTLDGTVLSEGMTDRQGSVTFTLEEPAATVRLQLRGITSTGTPLQLASTERSGIAVRLAGEETVLALRVEDDGTVLPDPSTMTEVGGAPLAIPSFAETPVLAPAPMETAVLVADGAAVATAPPSPPTAAALPRTRLPAELRDATGKPVAKPATEPMLPVVVLLSLAASILLGMVGRWLWLRSRGGEQR